MASSSFSRFLITSKQTLTVLSRSYTSLASSSTSLSKASILRYRPIVAVAAHFHRISPATSARTFATRPASSSVSDPNPNWSNRPPKETILLDGCDFEHWLVVMEKPEKDVTRDEIIESYIKVLAEVVGSVEEARMKIYSVSTRHYFAFGALVSEELSFKLKDVPGVRWVLPDSYLDVKNKDYGGEPFINGQAVPYDPKYHEEWVRNNARANERNRRNDRPRNFDRSRNFERRRENVQNAGPNADLPNTQGPPPNMQRTAGPPPPYAQSGPPGYAPNQNFQSGPPGPAPAGVFHPNNNQNFQPGPPGGYQPNNQNFQNGGRPNYGGGGPSYQPGSGPNYGGPNYQPPSGGPPNPAYQNEGPRADYQGGGYPPNNAAGPPYQNQTQNIPGRDVPPPNYR